MKTIIISIILLMTLFFNSLSFATMILRGRGETLIPINDKDIEMDSLKVTITKDEKEKWNFDAFYFIHCDKDKIAFVGVPEPLSDSYKEGEMVFEDFQIFVNDQKINYEIRENITNPIYPNKTFKRVIVWPINFKDKKQVTIRNRYSFVSDILGQKDESMYYTFRTASLWKNNIKKAKIIVQGKNFDPFYLVNASPPNYEFKNNSFEWNFGNFKPNFNISICYRGAFQCWFLNSIKAIKNNDLKEIYNSLESGEYIGQSIYVIPGWEYYGIKFRDKYLETMERLFKDSPANIYLTRYRITAEFLKNNKEKVRQLCRSYAGDIENGKIKYEFVESYLESWFSWNICEGMLGDYYLAKKFYSFGIESIEKQLQSNKIEDKNKKILEIRREQIKKSIQECNKVISLVERMKNEKQSKILINNLEQGKENKEVLGYLCKLKYDAYPFLIAALKSPEYRRYDVIHSVIYSLGNMKDYKDVFDILCEELKCNNALMRETTARALSNLGKNAIMPLKAALKDGAENVRLEASNSLLKLGNEEGIPILISLLESSNGNIQTRAIDTLEKIIGNRFEFNPGPINNVNKNAIEKIKNWWQVEKTEHSDLEIRKQ